MLGSSSVAKGMVKDTKKQRLNNSVLLWNGIINATIKWQ